MISGIFIMILQRVSIKLLFIRFFICAYILATVNINSQDFLATAIQSFNLTGVWKGNDGGTYYIRNIGNDIWWLGISSADDGKTFSNVLKGHINRDNKTINADWVDIPRGNNGFYGTLTLSIDSNAMLHKVNESSYSISGKSSCCFGASTWKR